MNQLNLKSWFKSIKIASWFYCFAFYLFGLESFLEDSQEGGQAESVHVVDLGQVTDDKVHPAATLSQGEISVPLLNSKVRVHAISNINAKKQKQKLRISNWIFFSFLSKRTLHRSNLLEYACARIASNLTKDGNLCMTVIKASYMENHYSHKNFPRIIFFHLFKFKSGFLQTITANFTPCIL